MEKQKLPDKMSELIRVAIVDLEKVEKLSEVYRINMSRWHVADDDSDDGKVRCSVCLAGAVMAQTLGADATQSFRPGSFNESCKLNAIEDFRTGDISAAARFMGILGNDSGYSAYRNKFGEFLFLFFHFSNLLPVNRLLVLAFPF